MLSSEDKASVSIVAFFTILAAVAFYTPIDQVVATFFHGLHLPILDFIMFTISFGGEIFAGLILVTILIALPQFRKIGVLLAVVGIINFIVVMLTKSIVARPRPFGNDILFSNLPFAESASYSFPSGHTARTVIGAKILSNFYPRFQSLFYLGAFLVAFSRIYLEVHYVSDVLAGFALGYAIAWLSLKFIYPYIENRLQ